MLVDGLLYLVKIVVSCDNVGSVKLWIEDLSLNYEGGLSLAVSGPTRLNNDSSTIHGFDDIQPR